MYGYGFSSVWRDTPVVWQPRVGLECCLSQRAASQDSILRRSGHLGGLQTVGIKLGKCLPVRNRAILQVCDARASYGLGLRLLAFWHAFPVGARMIDWFTRPTRPR